MTNTKILTFNRILPATCAKVMQSLTSAEARMQWGTPDPDSVLVIDNQPEPVERGRETSTVGPRGNPYVTVLTDWIEISPQRVSYAETLQAEGESFAISLAIFDLAPEGAQTAIHVTVMIASHAGEEVLPEVSAGWTQAIDALDGYLNA